MCGGVMSGTLIPVGILNGLYSGQATDAECLVLLQLDKSRDAPTKNKIASFFMYLFVKRNRLLRKAPGQTSMQHQHSARLKVFYSYVILI